MSRARPSEAVLRGIWPCYGRLEVDLACEIVHIRGVDPRIHQSSELRQMMASDLGTAGATTGCLGEYRVGIDVEPAFTMPTLTIRRAGRTSIYMNGCITAFSIWVYPRPAPSC